MIQEISYYRVGLKPSTHQWKPGGTDKRVSATFNETWEMGTIRQSHCHSSDSDLWSLRRPSRGGDKGNRVQLTQRLLGPGLTPNSHGALVAFSETETVRALLCPALSGEAWGGASDDNQGM